MTIKNINTRTLQEWLKNNEAIIVDVRQPGEHKTKKIPESTLLPLNNISNKNLPKDSSKKIVIHCHSGTRSSKACQSLLKENPNCDIYNLEGGISAWIDQGGDYESSGKIFLPLDRQVQLIIGSGVLLGTILGYLVNPNFFLLSGFFGAGLTFASISGFCGLARLLMKMPWNR